MVGVSVLTHRKPFSRFVVLCTVYLDCSKTCRRRVELGRVLLTNAKRVGG